MALPTPLNVISLCAGGGGLDLGFELAIPTARTVCMVEREAFAVAALVEAMRQDYLDECPVWSDVTTFNGRAWRGAVDCVIGGIPCQPHSQAGRQLGREDERDLWAATRRIIVQSGAWLVLIENVEGMLSSGGAERLLRDLERLGFSAEIGLFSAAETGASHQRNRVFVLAYHPGRRRMRGTLAAARPARSIADRTGGLQLADACSSGLEGVRRGHTAPGRQAEVGHAGLAGGKVLEDTDRRQPPRRPGGPGEPNDPGAHCQPAGSGGVLVNADRGRCDRRTQGAVGTAQRRIAFERPGPGCGQPLAYASGLQRGEVIGREPDGVSQSVPIDPGGLGDRPFAPPGPDDTDGWRYILERWPEFEPAVCGVVDGLASRVDRLRMLGNGVHPVEAGFAVRCLAARLAARLGGSAHADLMGLIGETQ